jgi:hypothetical protein
MLNKEEMTQLKREIMWETTVEPTQVKGEFSGGIDLQIKNLKGSCRRHNDIAFTISPKGLVQLSWGLPTPSYPKTYIDKKRTFRNHTYSSVEKIVEAINKWIVSFLSTFPSR